jgi:topoisomerase-4 subunit A
LLVEKFDPEKIITAVYLDDEKKQYNVKRFNIENDYSCIISFSSLKKARQRLEAATTDAEPVLAVQQGRGSQVRRAKFKLDKVVEVMGGKLSALSLLIIAKAWKWNG